MGGTVVPQPNRRDRVSPPIAQAQSWQPDHRWLSLNAQPLPDGNYRLPTPAVQRPLSTIPSKHRGRTQARRTYRHIVTSTVASYFV